MRDISVLHSPPPTQRTITEARGQGASEPSQEDLAPVTFLIDAWVPQLNPHVLT